MVATVGRRGIAKLVTRKEIQGVQIPQACGKIIEPGAPLALRLSGNLLYGVSRIYSEQARYVLDDAEKTRTAMAVLWRRLAIAQSETDPRAGRAS